MTVPLNADAQDPDFQEFVDLTETSKYSSKGKKKIIDFTNLNGMKTSSKKKFFGRKDSVPDKAGCMMFL